MSKNIGYTNPDGIGIFSTLALKVEFSLQNEVSFVYGAIATNAPVEYNQMSQ